MRLLNLFLFLFFVLFNFSCSQHKTIHNESALFENNHFDKYFKLEKEIYLKGEDFTGAIDEVLIWKNKIFVGDFSKSYKVVVYDKEGKEIGLLGTKGQGPGSYQSVNLIFPISNNIVLFDPLKLSFIFFNSQTLTFVRNEGLHKKFSFFTPDWYSLFPEGNIALYSPRVDDNGERVFVFSKDFVFLDSFCSDEDLFKKVYFGGLKNICVDKIGRVWVAGFFSPLVEVYNNQGEKLFVIDDFCFRSDMQNIKSNTDLTLKTYLKKYYARKGAIYGIFSVNNAVLVYYKIPYKTGQLNAVKSFFSLYDLTGKLIVKDVKLPTNIEFVNVNGNYLIFYDMWSKEVEQTNSNAKLMFLKFKK